jgi:hypothetical protein
LSAVWSLATPAIANWQQPQQRQGAFLRKQNRHTCGRIEAGDHARPEVALGALVVTPPEHHDPLSHRALGGAGKGGNGRRWRLCWVAGRLQCV